MSSAPAAQSSQPAAPAPLQVDAAAYLGLAAAPASVRDRLAIAVTSHTFLPRADDLPNDWVATVATPVFKLIRRRQGVQPAFCSIGTGAGLDALAAIETLGSARVGITDVHEDVVRAASLNITANLRPGRAVELEAGHGDLLSPLSGYKRNYDLIYENLPNVPIQDAARFGDERVSSSHVPPRAEPVPDSVQRQLLTLHYLALRQAREFLAPGGSVISMLGSRMPLAVFHEMARLAGLRSEIYAYTWKVQTDPEAMIGAHAGQQRAGFGPFHFYRASRLAEVFSGVELAASGERAAEIERQLAPDRLDAPAAWDALQRGETIGHTAAVLRSWPA